MCALAGQWPLMMRPCLAHDEPWPDEAHDDSGHPPSLCIYWARDGSSFSSNTSGTGCVG